MSPIRNPVVARKPSLFEVIVVMRLSAVIRLSSLLLLPWIIGCNDRPSPSGMAPQFPSPMQEHVREHARVARTDAETFGDTLSLSGFFDRSVEIIVPPDAGQDSVDLLIHFHGASFVVRHAVASSSVPTVAAIVNLGSGSSAYERPMSGRAVFPNLVVAIEAAVGNAGVAEMPIRHVFVSAFSAGYGAVRAILRDPEAVELVDGIILMDGLHASYVPERTTLAEGGAVDSLQMDPFVQYATRAAAGEKKMLFTHSEIFPGTYCSTTETADYLIDQLGLARSAVLTWGPVGMQQISETREGALEVRGFAGNTAPDHIDHFHALAEWLSVIRALDAQ